jgi:hypothetical protein
MESEPELFFLKKKRKKQEEGIRKKKININMFLIKNWGQGKVLLKKHVKITIPTATVTLLNRPCYYYIWIVIYFKSFRDKLRIFACNGNNENTHGIDEMGGWMDGIRPRLKKKINRLVD